MSSDTAIRTESISKRYYIGQIRHRTTSSRQQLLNMFRDPVRRLRQLTATQMPEYSEESIWALEDISFEVKQGEVIGIIGRNGAGKSTLLKILTGITKPTSGRAEIYGRVGSLLEVGTGFHPELTGRENVYLNGTILGMRRAEIDAQFDQIVAFSEVEKFIDTPVKRYSSGMNVRLAFSVAAHLQAEVLLVDEVLAVGDSEFQRKCLGKMSDVAGAGRTVLFVSHNMATINALCPRCLLFEHGHIVLDDKTDKVLAHYLNMNAESQGELTFEAGYAEPGITEFLVHRIALQTQDGCVASEFESSDSILVSIEYEVLRPVHNCRVALKISNSEGIVILQSFDVDNAAISYSRQPGRYTATCTIPAWLLSPGRYLLAVTADIQHIKMLCILENRLSFHVNSVGAVGAHVGGRRVGIIRPNVSWVQG